MPSCRATVPMARTLGCFPIGDPANPVPRRSSQARTPGITLNPGQLATDIAFVHVSLPPGNTDTSIAPIPAAPGVLVGDFAWIITSDGRASVVQIFDDCPQPNQQDLNNTSTSFPHGICDLNNVYVSRFQTRQQLGHPEPLLYDRLPRAAGQTKYPFFKMVRFAWDGITSFSAMPLRLAMWCGSDCMV